MARSDLASRRPALGPTLAASTAPSGVAGVAAAVSGASAPKRNAAARPARAGRAVTPAPLSRALPSAAHQLVAPDVLGAAPELDRLIHERLRLGIVSALAVNESLSFNDLKQLLHTTDGNLSVHARKLEEAGYIACSKYFEGRLPKTEYRLTTGGREALGHYLEYMEALIQTTRGV